MPSWWTLNVKVEVDLAFQQALDDSSFDFSVTASLSELLASPVFAWLVCAWESETIPKTTNIDLKKKISKPSSKISYWACLHQEILNVKWWDRFFIHLGSEDLMSGWLAWATKGAFRAAVLFNAFSSCAGGSWKTIT